MFKRIGHLAFSRDGAVTVFAVVVLSALLLFVSVFIDYARVALLHKMTEDAARAGARSVLSAYDGALYGRYGLFGRGGTDAETIYSRVVGANLARASSSANPALRMVNPSVEASHVNAAEVLGNHGVFRRQVLEEMKYKAPIDFTLELAGKFTPLSGAMKEAAATVQVLERLRKLYEARQAKLGQVLALQRAAAKALSDSGIGGMIPADPADLQNGGTDTAIGIARQYAEYAGWVIDNESLEEGAKPAHRDDIEDYRDSAGKLLEKLRPAGTAAMKKHAALQTQAVKELEEAERLNAEMTKLFEEAKQAGTGTGYDKATGKDTPGTNQGLPANTEKELEEIRTMGEEVIFQDGWFREYREELSEQAAAYASLDMEIGGFSSNLTDGLDHPDSFNERLLEGALNLRIAYEQYDAKYIRQGSIPDLREGMLTDKKLAKQLTEQRARADSLWREARGFLHAMTSLPQNDEHERVFNEVNALYENNMAFNQASEEAAEAVRQPADADEGADSSYSLMDGIFGGIGDMLARGRDTVYFGEYAAQRFSSFPPQNLKAAMQNGDLSELAQGVTLSNQEAEYILYGFPNSTGNLAAAYGELFGVRYAIRTMEGLSACKASGHPLLILSCSLIYGVEKTMEDMISFAEKGAAPLSKYIAVDIAYVDYLRLFMLLHGIDGAEKIARMSAVIEHNTGTRLSEVPSAISGEVTASADLWFIPGVMRLLGSAGLLQGKVAGGRYETTQTAGLSY